MPTITVTMTGRLRFFGFIKDTSGRIVPDAKVTAEIEGLRIGRNSQR